MNRPQDSSRPNPAGAYRPEIDGLRAVAVLSVIVAHAGAPLRGGFLGVDIFFVISGFLITRILADELAMGRFSLARFYERRARRILPALMVVLAACVPAAWLLMTPDELAGFGRSLFATGLFASNIVFWRESGYFAPVAEELPLLHTWSLGVEEQFYLLFPLLLACLWRRQLPVFAILGALLLLSLAAAEVAARLSPNAAFYLLPFRAWELLAGSLAALWVHRYGVMSVRGGGVLALAGLALIGGSLVFYHPWLPIPGLWLAAPVGGTVLVLLFATHGTWVARLLAWRPAVAIGLISYSAYLWHQPLFAFARLGQLDPPGPITMAGLVVVTLGLAWASWWFIENPFRNHARTPLRPLVWGLGTAGAGLTVLGLVLHLGQGMGPARFAPADLALLDSAQPSPMRGTCHATPSTAPQPAQACRYPNDAAPSWAVFGDSHAVELAYALGEGLSARGDSLVHFSTSGCPPALGFETDVRDCADWVGRTTAWLEQADGIDTVVLAWRHSAYLFGRNEHAYPELPDTPYRILGPGGPTAKRGRYWAAFEGLVMRLRAAGKRVIVLAPVPEVARPVDKYVRYGPRTGAALPTIPRAYHDARHAWVHTRLAALDAEILDPTPQLCGAEACYAGHAGTAFYFDDNHLSVAGARKVIASLLAPSPTVKTATR